MKKLKLPEEIVALIRKSHPDLKRKIRKGFEKISEDSISGKALRDELKGLWSYRIGSFRIIYKKGRRHIEIVAVGPRKRIYLDTYKLIRKNLH